MRRTHPLLRNCRDNAKLACHCTARYKIEWIYIKTKVSGPDSLEVALEMRKKERKKERRNSRGIDFHAFPMLRPHPLLHMHTWSPNVKKKTLASTNQDNAVITNSIDIMGESTIVSRQRRLDHCCELHC